MSSGPVLNSNVMANELKITDVVDQKAFDQLRNFKAELNENYSIYKKLALELAGGVKINPKTFQELSDKSILYNKTLNDLIVTQNRMAAIQENIIRLWRIMGIR